MVRTSHVALLSAAASLVLLSIIPEEATARSGFRFGGGRFFARSSRFYPYGSYGSVPYGGFSSGSTPTVYYVGGGLEPGSRPLPPRVLTCQHSEATVTVPSEGGAGAQQIKISRC
jgi:hypothetical protein